MCRTADSTSSLNRSRDREMVPGTVSRGDFGLFFPPKEYFRLQTDEDVYCVGILIPEVLEKVDREI